MCREAAGLDALAAAVLRGARDAAEELRLLAVARRNVGFAALEPEEFDFRLELDAIRFPYLPIDMTDDGDHICRGRRAGVDDKVTVNR